MVPSIIIAIAALQVKYAVSYRLAKSVVQAVATEPALFVKGLAPRLVHDQGKKWHLELYLKLTISYFITC